MGRLEYCHPPKKIESDRMLTFLDSHSSKKNRRGHLSGHQYKYPPTATFCHKTSELRYWYACGMIENPLRTCPFTPDIYFESDLQIRREDSKAEVIIRITLDYQDCFRYQDCSWVSGCLLVIRIALGHQDCSWLSSLLLIIRARVGHVGVVRFISDNANDQSRYVVGILLLLITADAITERGGAPLFTPLPHCRQFLRNRHNKQVGFKTVVCHPPSSCQDSI